jgi:hypothetical protein
MMKKIETPILPVIALFVLTLFVFMPATIYLTNSVEFSNSLPDLLLAGACLSLVFALVLRLMFLALRAAGLRFLEWGVTLLFVIAFMTWLQGNFLLWSYGPLDGRYIPWATLKLNGYIDGSLWIAALVAAIALPRFILRHARISCLALNFMQFAYSVFLFCRRPETPSFQRYTVDTTEKFTFSKNRNLILVILDSFQSDVFAEVIREDPGLAGALDGFTFYRNALAGYPATELSVALMMTGKFYDNSQPFEDWKHEAYMGDSLPRVLKASGWQVDIYPDVSYSLYYSDEIASNFIEGVPWRERALDIVEIYDLTLFRCLPHFLKPFVYNNQAWLLKPRCQRFILRAKPKKVHSTRVTPTATRKLRDRNRRLFTRRAYLNSPVIRFFDQMLCDAHAVDNKGAFKFYHLMIPHIPLLIDRNLKYRRMEVSRENYKEYAAAAVRLMGYFLENLKQIGIYDDSLVVIVGDHGAGHQGQVFNWQKEMPTRRGEKMISHPSQVSALPLVLVKRLHARGGLKFSDAPVSLGDIPATVLADLRLEARVPGVPMQALDPVADRRRRFMVYAGRDIFSYFGDMTEYIVTGYAWLADSWHASGKVYTRHGVRTP